MSGMLTRESEPVNFMEFSIGPDDKRQERLFTMITRN